MSGSSEHAAVARVLLASPGTQGGIPDCGRALQGHGLALSLEVVRDAPACARALAAGDSQLLVLDAGCASDEAGEMLGLAQEAGLAVVVAALGSGPLELAYWGSQPVAACASTGAELAAAVRDLLDSGGAAEIPGSVLPSTAILRGLNVALLAIDAAGRISHCNEPAARILGTRAEALQGLPLASCLGSPVPEAHPVAQSLSRGDSFEGYETTLLRADGRNIAVGLSCAPIPGPGGDRAGVVAVFNELREARRMRGDVLQREKMASIGQLAAGVAHEINNPMGFIHANLAQTAEYASELRQIWSRVEALQKVALAGDPVQSRVAAQELAAAAEEVDVSFVLGDLAKAIRESQEGSERIRHIVQDLRDFSHPDSSEREAADVNQCLDSTANIVWPMMKHLVVLQKNYADLPPVPAYPMQIKQVLMNLLVNAYQAIEQRVGRSGEMGTIEVETRVAPEGVEIRVSDDGVGISEEHLQRIFDPFFTTKRVGSGMGLGLSTSFKIVERHGGTLSVESEENVGTTMRLFLPTGPAAPG
ncbi:MAG: PAS domain S-box protein [Myxococcales bacterium]|nr:PAS domain S-box protein [Myxococcales bacterium]